MAKTKELSLDVSIVSDSFFEDRLLLGIKTHWSSIRFCIEMNNKLGINFERILKEDINIRFDSDAALGLGIPGTLFAEIPCSNLVAFGIFEHPIPFSSECFRLYSNKEQEFALLSQFPQYSHLFLLSQNSLMHYEKPLSDWIGQLDGVENCEFIDTDELGKDRERLIF